MAAGHAAEGAGEKPFLTRPKGPLAEPTPFLYVANCGAEAGVPYDRIGEVFARFGAVKDVFPAGTFNLTRCFVVFESADSAAAAKAALHQTPCAELGDRKMHIDFAVLKVTPKEDIIPVALTAEGLGIPGLHLHRDFISEAEEEALLHEVDAGEWHYLTKRRVQHYGYAFNYKTRDIERSQRIGPLPEFAGFVVQRCEALPELSSNCGPEEGSPHLPLDQLTVNEYERGVGLAPHIDTHIAFEGVVLSLSLAGPCIMEFRRIQDSHGATSAVSEAAEADAGRDGQPGDAAEHAEQWEWNSDERRALFLPARSLLVLTGEARYAWSHYIPNHKFDVVNGERIARAPRRVSFTFRRVRLSSCCDCPYPHQCDAPRPNSHAAAIPTANSTTHSTPTCTADGTTSHTANHSPDSTCSSADTSTASSRLSSVDDSVPGCESSSRTETNGARLLDGSTCVEPGMQAGTLPGGASPACVGQHRAEHVPQDDARPAGSASTGIALSPGAAESSSGAGVEGEAPEKEFGSQPSFRSWRISVDVGDSSREGTAGGAGCGALEHAEDCSGAVADSMSGPGRATPEDGAPAVHHGGARGDHASEGTPEIERKYVHQVYDAIAPHFSATRFAKWPKVAAFLESLPAGSLILDAGCGNGKYLGYNPRCQFIGVDISAPLVKICRARGHEVGVADAMNLPFRDGTFDAAISIAVLHHLSTPVRRRAAIEELLRVVKPGGQVLITVWAREQENQSLLNKWTALAERHATRWVDAAPVSPRTAASRSSSALDQVNEEKAEPALGTRSATTGSQPAPGSTSRGILEKGASIASPDSSVGQSPKEGLSRNLDRFTERWVETTGSPFSLQVEAPKSKSATTSPRTPGVFSGVFKDFPWPAEPAPRARGPDSSAHSEGALESPSGGRFLHGPSRFGGGKALPAAKSVGGGSLAAMGALKGGGLGHPASAPLLRSSSGSLPGKLSRPGSGEALPSFRLSAVKDSTRSAQHEGLALEGSPLRQRSLPPPSQFQQQKISPVPGSSLLEPDAPALLPARTSVPGTDGGTSALAASDSAPLQHEATLEHSLPQSAATSPVFECLEEEEAGLSTDSVPRASLAAPKGATPLRMAPQAQQHQTVSALPAAGASGQRDGRPPFLRSKSATESQMPSGDPRHQAQALPPRSPALNLFVGTSSSVDQAVPHPSSAGTTPRAGLGASAGAKGLPPMSPGGFGKRPPPSVVLPGSHGGTPVGSPRGGFPSLSPKSPLAKAYSVGGVSSSLGGTPLSSPRSSSGLPPLSPRSPSSASSVKTPSMLKPPRSPRPPSALASPPPAKLPARPTSPLPSPLFTEASSRWAAPQKAQPSLQASQASAGATMGGATSGAPPQGASSPARSPLRRTLPPRPSSPLESPLADRASSPLRPQAGVPRTGTSSPLRTSPPIPAPPAHQFAFPSSSRDCLPSAGLQPGRTSSPVRTAGQPKPAGLAPLRPSAPSAAGAAGLPPRSKSPLKVELNAGAPSAALDGAGLEHAQSLPALPSALPSAEVHVQGQCNSGGAGAVEGSRETLTGLHSTALAAEGPRKAQALEEGQHGVTQRQGAIDSQKGPPLSEEHAPATDASGAAPAAAGTQELGAMEGAHESQAATEPAPQEYLVPWHLPIHRVDIASEEVKSALDSGFARKDNAKGSVVYNRFYHVFTQGELERLAREAGGPTIVDKFYDKSNWCIVIQRNLRDDSSNARQ